MAHEAAMAGDVLSLEAWLSSHNDCNAISEAYHGRSLLHCAAFSGSVPCVEALLRYKSIDLNRKDRLGLTPLQCACFKNRIEVVKMLVDAGADMNIPDNDQSTALQKVCQEGFKDVVEVILKKSKDVKEKLLLEGGKSLDETTAPSTPKSSAVGDTTPTSGRSTLKSSSTDIEDGSFYHPSIVQINAQEANGLTALHIATERGHAAIVQVLVRHGADPNIQDVDGQTPLHVATYHLHPKTVRYLLKKAASPELADVEGATPLHLASWIGNEELVEMLSEAMFNPATCVDLDGQTAISLAAEQGNIACVKALLDMDDDAEEDYEERRKEAVEAAAISAASISTNTTSTPAQSQDSNEAAPINTDSSSPTNKTSLTNNTINTTNNSINTTNINNNTNNTTVTTSTSSTVSMPQFPTLHIDMLPDVLGETPLHKAALYNRAEVLEVLLRKLALMAARRAALGSAIGSPQQTRAAAAAAAVASSGTSQGMNSSSSSYYLYAANNNIGTSSASVGGAPGIPTAPTTEYSVDVVDMRKATALLGASFNGHSRCVSLLLEFGAAVNHQDEEGATALHKSAYNGHLEVLEMLIAKQSAIDMPDYSGATPLHKAAFNGQTGAVVLLCKVGARVDAYDLQGGLPLHNAAYGGHAESVAALMRFMTAAGRDVAAADADGFNALHMAASQGHDHLVLALLKHRDSPFLIDTRTLGGWTPLLLALKQQHTSTALLLAQMGASFVLDKALSRRLRNVPQALLAQIQHEVAVYSSSSKDGSSSQGGDRNSSRRHGSISSASASSRRMSISGGGPPASTATTGPSTSYASDAFRSKHSYGMAPTHSISYAHLTYTPVAAGITSISSSTGSSSSKGRRKTDRGQSVSAAAPPPIAGVSPYASSGAAPYEMSDSKKSKRKSSKKSKKSKGSTRDQDDEFDAHGLPLSTQSDFEYVSPHHNHLHVNDYATDTGGSPRNESPTAAIPSSRKASRRASASADPVLTAQSTHSGRKRTDSVSMSSNDSIIAHPSQASSTALTATTSGSAAASPATTPATTPGSARRRGDTWTGGPGSGNNLQGSHLSSYELSRGSTVNKPPPLVFASSGSASGSGTQLTSPANGGGHPSSMGLPRKSFRRQNDPPEVTQAIELFKRNPGDAVELLIEAEILEDNCTAVAKWLWEREDIDRPSLGLFLSRDKNWNSAILDSFVELFDFDGLDFDSALRRYLSKFRLPGEAQKIDRLMETFAVRYYAQNSKRIWLEGSSQESSLPAVKNGLSPSSTGSASDSSYPLLFADKDSIYVLAFSVIMLNTDAHNPAIKKANKMTKAQFIRNVSGINGGRDFPSSFLSELYDKIVNHEIKMDAADVLEEFEVASPRVGGGGGPVSPHSNPPSARNEEFSTAALKGYLMKQGGKVKSWKKRWFVLDGNCLFYFNSSSDKDPLGIIPLENLTVSALNTASSSSKRRYTFQLQNPNEGPIKATVRKGSSMVVGNHEQYTFQAASEQELSLWVDSLNRNIFRNPFYLLLANKKKQMESKGKHHHHHHRDHGAGSSGAISPPSASSPAQAAHLAQAQSQAHLGGSSSAIASPGTTTPVSPRSMPSSPAMAHNTSSSSHRKGKNSSSSSIQRNDSIFAKAPAAPQGETAVSPAVPSDPLPTSFEGIALSPHAPVPSSSSPASAKLSKRSGETTSSSSSRVSLTVTPRDD